MKIVSLAPRSCEETGNGRNRSTKLSRKEEAKVQVVAGKDKGKQGKVIGIDREKGKAIVAGCNVVKKAQKKRKQTDRGGIVEIKAPWPYPT